MDFKFIIVIIFTFSFFLSCNKSTTEPPEDPPGYQRDIPWPSLADSPWPMERGDAQGTGRSKSWGPRKGISSIMLDSINIYSGFIVGKDSVIYFIGKSWKKDNLYNMHLYSILPNRQIKQLYKLENRFKNFITPTCLSDGSIIFVDKLDIYSSLCCLDKSGNLKWKYDAGTALLGRSLAVDKESNIYAGTTNDIGTANKNLISLDKNGNLRWALDLGQRNIDGAVFSPDGKTLYMLGDPITLIAVDIENHNIKWKYGNKRISPYPIIDNEGSIYLIGSPFWSDTLFYITKLSANGEVKWQYNTGLPTYITRVLADGVLDKFGNLYAAFANKLISIKTSGELNWLKDLSSDYVADAPLSCDSENIIYVTGGNNILAYDKSGNQLFAVQGPFSYYSSIGLFNGIMLFSLANDKLIIIE